MSEQISAAWVQSQARGMSSAKVSIERQINRVARERNETAKARLAARGAVALSVDAMIVSFPPSPESAMADAASPEEVPNA